MFSLEKITKCPHCGIEKPLLTLVLQNSQFYNDPEKVPDYRHYDLQCLNCGKFIFLAEIANTIKAVKELRDELDQLYGKSVTWPIV